MRRPRTPPPAAYRTASLLRETPGDESPRERLLTVGPAALSDAELLALVLGGGRPAPSTLDRAQALLLECDGLPGLRDLALHQLRLPPTKAAVVLAAVELARRLALADVPDRHPMTRAAEVVRYLHLRYSKVHQEVLGALYLTTRNRLIGCREVYRGTLSRAAVEPREILRDGLLRAAGSVVMFHCHPSGDPEPSGEDILFTRRMAQAGELVGIPLRDHLIIAGSGRWVALRERGAV